MCSLMRFLRFMCVCGFFYTHLYCLLTCLSMIVWTDAVLGVLYACALVFLYLHLFSAIEHVSHGKALLEILSLLLSCIACTTLCLNSSVLNSVLIAELSHRTTWHTTGHVARDKRSMCCT